MSRLQLVPPITAYHQSTMRAVAVMIPGQLSATTNAPSARYHHRAVWTGTEMIVWGGANATRVFNTGGKYNSSTDSWTAISTTNAPSGRAFHTAVWTGTEMIVWGGESNNFPFSLNTGGRYNPGTDSWTHTSTINAPSARYDHTAVSTGNEMIIWGGLDLFRPFQHRRAIRSHYR